MHHVLDTHLIQGSSHPAPRFLFLNKKNKKKASWHHHIHATAHDLPAFLFLIFQYMSTIVCLL